MSILTMIMAAAGGAVDKVWKTVVSMAGYDTTNSVRMDIWNFITTKQIGWSPSLNRTVVTGSVTNPPTSAGSGYSDNFQVWKPCTAAAVASSIIWDGSKFVGVSNSAAFSSYVHISTDGITWTSYSIGVSTAPLNWLVYNGTIYVAVGNSGTIITSSDGINWTARTSGTTYAVVFVVWDGTKFIAVSNVSTVSYTCLSSTDGITWTYLSSSAPSLSAFDYYNGIYFKGDAGLTYYSYDCVNWTAISYTGTRSQALAFAYSGSVYVSVGANGRIARSTDGINWTYKLVSLTTVAVNSVWRAVKWTGDRFIITSSSASGAVLPILWSYDGDTWYLAGKLKIPTGSNTSEIRYSQTAGMFVMPSSSILYSSTDGENWKIGLFDSTIESILTGSNLHHSVDYSPTLNVWLSVNTTPAATGTPIKSSDGVNWTKAISSGTIGDCRSVLWFKDRFLAFSGSSTIYYTLDANTWSSLSYSGGSGSSLYARASACSNNNAVAVMDDGDIIVSSDAITWTFSTHITGSSKVCWTGSRFLLLSVLYGIYTSTDGASWSLLNNSRNFSGIAALSDSEYYAASQSDADPNVLQYFKSTDVGVTWTPVHDEEIYYATLCMVGGNNKLVSYTYNAYGYNYSGHLTLLK